MSKTSKVSAEQFKEWKEKYGAYYKLITEDDKEGWIFDPLSSVNIMKLAFSAIQKSPTEYVKSVLNNCWLAGDESIKNDEKYVEGLVDQLDEITDLPKCEVKREGNHFIMKVEQVELKVRMAMRQDIIKAERKNSAREAFETAIHLLRFITLDKEKLKEIEDKGGRIYIGLLTGADKVKNKATVIVEKY